MSYRKLNNQEIEILIAQGCSAENWGQIEVKKEGFDASKIRNTSFSGDIRIGRNDSSIIQHCGAKKQCGIVNAFLHNVTVGDNTYILNIRNLIANYKIGDNCCISNIDSMETVGISTFGNGTALSVLNETGGRDVKIYDRLSAQIGYILTLYRHRPETINKINGFIDEYCKQVESATGEIGNNTCILNCGKIQNIKVGEYAVISGAKKLCNGTINSTQEAPSFVGDGVTMLDFIMSTSSNVDDGAIVDKCFIGQGCSLGKQYSAENSLFFANCLGMHGEACAIFAGPYTVTHHKSTLLIAGFFSFLNAGSGSNQSNHMYKLGPIHQGIVERGSKTTSDSYVLWPARIGAFSIVMGRHHKHSDTSLMPFSYIIESDNETVLVPGANLKSVGTIRDAKKWPKRDKRKGSDFLDQINFNLLSPFTIDKMCKAVGILKILRATSGETSEHYIYQSAKIKNSSLSKGIQLYETGIYKFLGNSLIKRLEGMDLRSIEQIRERLKPDCPIGSGDWIDMAGMIAPKDEVTRVLNDLEKGNIKSLNELHSEFVVMHNNYYTYEWRWAIEKICELLDKQIEEITLDDIISLIKRWKDCVIGLDHILYEDAKKEFTLINKIGFGVDGDENIRNQDFEQVRGEFENNDFVCDVLIHIKTKTELYNEVMGRLSKVK